MIADEFMDGEPNLPGDDHLREIGRITVLFSMIEVELTVLLRLTVGSYDTLVDALTAQLSCRQLCEPLAGTLSVITDDGEVQAKLKGGGSSLPFCDSAVRPRPGGTSSVLAHGTCRARPGDDEKGWRLMTKNDQLAGKPVWTTGPGPRRSAPLVHSPA